MNLENSTYYSYLCSLGSSFETDSFIDLKVFHDQLENLKDEWKVYNPKKPHMRRHGLSITSLEGEIDGKKDLTSLKEVNEVHNTHYDELSFRKLTPYYNNLTSLHKAVSPFEKFLGRSHLLKFEEGGYFPPHRDSQFYEVDTFRLFSILSLGNPKDFVFLLDGKCLSFIPGCLYFINTRLEHSVFNFSEETICLLLNVELCKESVDLVSNKLLRF